MRSTAGHEQCLRVGSAGHERCLRVGSAAESDCIHAMSKSASQVSHSRPSALQSIIVRRTHRDFVGLETADSTTRSAVINFSYHLTVGDMDEAFRAIRVVKWLVTAPEFMSYADLSLVYFVLHKIL